jgi:RNA polymerase sigma factor (sigma-70 family)
MAEKKNLYIRVEGQPVEVTREIYYEYHRLNRRERYLEESDLVHGKTYYANLDTEESRGEDGLPDLKAEPLEDRVVRRIMTEQLRECLGRLNSADRALIKALFFANGGAGMTEREYTAAHGIPQQTVNDRRHRIIAKLRNMMDQ